jgi:predicted HTH domain antitoxin
MKEESKEQKKKKKERKTHIEINLFQPIIVKAVVFIFLLSINASLH